ncbi:MAG TPA: helix-turn-helix domain-containing protein, partial [Herpetosiphonaceae bacterium]|nr:helix-turn-helix domain-containing protein [Herpetosiphonaceae bacterium]
MPTAPSFGSWLKQRRQALDLTQPDLARRVGCSVDTIYRIEAGTRRPSKQIAARLAAVLEIPAEQIPSFLRLARAAPEGAVEQQAGRAFAGATTRRPQATPKGSPANLPVPPTPIVGREQEVAELRAQLLRPEVRLVTLLGPAGAGKTRLSLEVAADVLDEFDDGVCFVRLEAVTGAELVEPAIARMLGVREGAGETMREALLTHLRDRQLLLVLDNFEQIVAAAPVVAELLSLCAGLKLLVTSREPLRVRSEWLFDLEGLRYPPDEGATGFEDYSAVQLFVQRAQQLQRRWMPVGSEAQAVARICRLVEGLPLAIELAAAAVRERSCSEIARELESGLHTLATSARDVPERHRSMWAALEHSWQGLSEAERGVFPRLAVFRGGFEEAAAVEVAGASRDVLAALLAKSLVRHTAQPDGKYRHQLHELVRQYAGEKLRDVGESTATSDRHLDYYLNVAEAAAPRLVGPEQPAWLARLESEHENLRAALGWALETRQVERALRLAAALKRFWYFRGYWSEGRTWLARALAQSDPSVPSLPRACALFSAGELARYQSDYGAAIGLLKESEALFQALGDGLHRGLALQGL